MAKTTEQNVDYKAISIGLVGLVVGLFIAGITATMAVNSDNHSMMNTFGMRPGHSHGVYDDNHAGMSMSAMTEQLQDKKGDDFDKAFIDMMIVHHEGAIEMANLIGSRAQHDEIKTLGTDIISAQTKEIEQMKSWQKTWGYAESNDDYMMHDMH